MPHPVVYPGDLDELIKKWEAQRSKDWYEHNPLTFIANGQCARLPQELTSVGNTKRWRPGARVVDVAKTLRPGTVIANFKLVDGELKYPNEHHYHAAIFVRGEGYSVATGKPSQIIVFDQWVGATPTLSHTPGTRPIRAWTEETMRVRHQRFYPCDNANEFYVVEVP
jgi:hypothetical protein